MQKTFTYPKFEFVQPPELTEGKTGHYPVVVVGAGPVGLSAAIDLAQQDQDVLLLDWARELAPLMLEQFPALAARHVSRWLGGKAEYLKA